MVVKPGMDTIHPRSGGIIQPVAAHQYDRLPDFDPRTGDHLWVMAANYRWTPNESNQHHLDLENLLLLVGPGCYYCTEIYSPLMARRRCKGKP